jgi:hypothetical protein
MVRSGAAGAAGPGLPRDWTIVQLRNLVAVSLTDYSTMPLTHGERRVRNAIIVGLARRRVSCDSVCAILRAAGYGVSPQHARRIAVKYNCPFVHWTVANRPSQIMVDRMVAAFLSGHTDAYGHRPIIDRIHEHYPRTTRESVRDALRRINPAALQLRNTHAFRRRTRDGAFNAPHFGALWQSDLNLMLARYGLNP